MSLLTIHNRAGFSLASETFIRSQAEALPFRKALVSSGPVAVDGVPAWRGLSRWARWALRRDAKRTGLGAEGALMRRALAAMRPDAILAHYGPGAAEMAPHAEALGIPLVAHFHGYDASMHPVVAEWGDRYRAMFRTAARVVAVSRPMAARLEAMGCPPGKIVLNPYGIDLSGFSPDSAVRRPESFLAVGRFVEKKAPHLALAAFAEARRAFPGATMRMAGDGPLLGACRDLAALWGIAEAVEFPGAVDHEWVARAMREASVFVQHSVTPESGDMEGTPVGILEASASGLPVVSTRHAGIPEAVEDGVTGILVEERDVAGMAEAMKGMLADRDAAAAMGMRGRARMEREYGREARIGRLAEVIREAMAEGVAKPTMEKAR